MSAHQVASWITGVLLSIVVAVPVQAGPYVDAVLADDPIGYWRLEEGSGTAVDSATGGQNGQGNQDGTYMAGPGQVVGAIPTETSNMAANFTDNDGYVTIPDESGYFHTYVDPFLGGNPWSIEFWILNGNGGDPVVKGAHCCGTYFHHMGAGSGLRFGILSAGPPTSAVDFDDEPLGGGVWSHVVGVISTPDGFGTDARVYVNGDLVSDVGFTSVPDDDSDLFSEPLTIGALAFDGGTVGNFFGGAIDEVAIYGYALDDPNNTNARDTTRIRAHFAAACDQPDGCLPANGTWTAGGSGNWNDEDNWFGGLASGNDAPALLGDSITQPATIFTEAEVTVNSITFENENEFVIMGNGGVTLAAAAGTALVDVQAGSHQFQLPVTLAAAATVNAKEGTTLKFNGEVELGANDLTTQGTGTILFNNKVSSGGGMVTMNGNILGGSGRFEGDLVINDGGLAVQLSGQQQSGLTVDGNVSLNGTIEISLVDGFAPSMGETFDILTAATIDVGDLELLTAGDDAYALAVIGNTLGGETLQLTHLVPEPAAFLLVGLALMGSFVMRRKGSFHVVASITLVAVLGGINQPTYAQNTPYQDAVMADNPVGYWRFEESNVSSGQSAADTASGIQGDNPGTYVGNATIIAGGINTEPSQGILINNTTTDSANDYVRIADTFTEGAMGVTSFTLEAWLQPLYEGASGHSGCCGNYIVRGFYGDGGATFAQQRPNGGINAGRNAGAPANAEAILANQWSHVVVSFDGDTEPGNTIQTIYVNGTVAPEANNGGGGGPNPHTAGGTPNDDTGAELVIGALAFGSESDRFDTVIQAWHGGVDEVAYYDYVLPVARVAAHFGAAGFEAPQPGDWLSPVSGNWHTPGNWNMAAGPDSNTEHASFGNVIGEPRSVFTEIDTVVKSIEFDSPNEYAIGGNGGVILSSADTSSVDVVQGSHQFQGAVQTTAPTTATIASSSSLTFNGPLSLSGTITKEGPGTLNVNNDENAGGGSGIVVNEGLLGGHGKVDGDVINTSTGTVAPGNSPGILTIDGDYTQGANATLAIEIGGLVPDDDHDKLVVTGRASLAGTLDVTLLDGFGPNDGDSFDVLDFASVSGDFSTLNLPTNFSWNVSDGMLTFGSGGAGGFTDFDNDGTWNLGDLNLVLFNWQKSSASLPGEWVNQKPAVVGLDSLNNVLFNWQQSATSLATVPEPVSTILLGIGLLGYLISCRSARGQKG